MKIAGSFLKIQNKKEKINNLNNCVDYIHYDVMDGKFVENKTDIQTMIENTKNVTKPKDVHLMVNDIKKYIDEITKLKPNIITFHQEATNSPKEIIDYLHKLNIKAGLAINPNTDLNLIKNYLNIIDLVLVMSVNPGKGGQKFIDITDKIKQLKNIKTQNNYSYLIEVDGGINDQTIKNVNMADIVVVGSYITDSNDYQKQVEKLKGEKNE